MAKRKKRDSTKTPKVDETEQLGICDRINIVKYKVAVIYSVVNDRGYNEDTQNGASYLIFDILDELTALSDEVGDQLRGTA